MTRARFEVLFVCGRNQTLSVFAAAALREVAGQRFNAHSAGLAPEPSAHPLTVASLRHRGRDADCTAPRDLDAFRSAFAPRMDFVYFLGPELPSGSCVPWPDQSLTAWWRISDPAAATVMSLHDAARSFDAAYEALRARVEVLSVLPTARLDRVARRHRDQAVLPGSDPGRPIFVN